MVYADFGSQCRKKAHMLMSLQSVIQAISKKSVVWVSGLYPEILYVLSF